MWQMWEYTALLIIEPRRKSKQKTPITVAASNSKHTSSAKPDAFGKHMMNMGQLVDRAQELDRILMKSASNV